MILTFTVRLTFASDARGKSVSGVAWWACADWSLTLSPVVARRANGIASTWIWSAQVFWNELTAADEGIASHVSWAGADWSQPTEVAVSVGATCAITRILADSVVASWL
jgi:hypothetical protein